MVLKLIDVIGRNFVALVCLFVVISEGEFDLITRILLGGTMAIWTSIPLIELFIEVKKRVKDAN